MNKTLNVFGLTVQVNTLVFALWAAFLLAWIFAICGVAAPFITYSYAGFSFGWPLTTGSFVGLGETGSKWQAAYAMQVIAVIFSSFLLVTFWTPMIKEHAQKAFTWVYVALGIHIVFQFLTMCIGAAAYSDIKSDVDAADGFNTFNAKVTLAGGFALCIISWIMGAAIFVVLFMNSSKVIAGEDVPVFGKSMVSESAAAGGDAAAAAAAAAPAPAQEKAIAAEDQV